MGDKVPPPVNPADPLNSFCYEIGGGRDAFQTFPGLDGIPHRAKVARPLKNDDPEHLRPQPAGQVRCVTYDFSVEGDRQQYEQIASRIYTMARQGKGMILAHDRNFNQTKGSWVILLEWVEFLTYDSVSPRETGRVETGVLRRR